VKWPRGQQVSQHLKEVSLAHLGNFSRACASKFHYYIVLNYKAMPFFAEVTFLQKFSVLKNWKLTRVWRLWFIWWTFMNYNSIGKRWLQTYKRPHTCEWIRHTNQHCTHTLVWTVNFTRSFSLSASDISTTSELSVRSTLTDLWPFCSESSASRSGLSSNPS